ncbi:MAG: chromosome segregation protein SMC [Saccharofermentans sp.]|nr:chromosome segregation protein SMC [Saccharofermentans sp.]
MYLKKLELQGFKSFPEYTLIEFSQGMTAVVGPNGSGKSNVTDAIRWVLGEQSVKSLRGGKMEDVIFNGTQSRKAMNYAEVSITLDNSDHFVDVEYEEIQITRRLYRSGESEYQINHVNCRLKDIVRMFLDTGLGKDGYSIVGQGRVDEILSTKSEDRRRVIEEASGIVKYKVSKDEAERKLNSTEQNLLRIDDVLNELGDRIGPLKEQAEKASAYHKAYESLKEKDIALLCRRITDANNAMGDSASVKEKLEDEIRTQEDRFIALRENNTELTNKSEQLEITIEDKRQELSDVTEELHDINSDIKINDERIKQLEDRIAASKENEASINEDIAKLKDDYKKHIDNSDELLIKADEYKKQAEKLSEERDAVVEEFRSSEQSQNDIRKNIDDKTSELMTTRERINSSEAKIKALEDRIKEISESKKVSSEFRVELDEKLAKADEAWHAMMEQEAAVTSDINTRKEALKDLKNKEAELLKSFEQDNRVFLSEQARLKTLTDLESRKEGYQEAVRRLLNQADTDSSIDRAIVGVVGDLISTNKKYETAIEIALGAGIHNVVTNTEKEAAYLISVLKERRLGRVTFLPIENIKPRNIDRDVKATASMMKGYIGIASDLVDCGKNISDIISNLLGKIIVVDNMDNARAIASKTSHSVKVITLEGDTINPGGSLTGGSIRKDSAGILGRGREIEDIKKKIEQTEERLAKIEDERQEIDEKTGNLEREIAQLGEQLKFFELERVKAESEYRNTEERVKEMANSIATSEDSLHEISEEKLRLEDDLEELLLISKETEGELADFREDIEKNSNISREFNERIDKLRDAISEAQTASERILAERNGVLNLASHIKEQLSSHEANINDIKASIEEDTAAIDELKKGNSDRDEALKSLKTQYGVLSTKISELNAEKAEVEKELSGFVNRITDINSTLNNLREKLNSLVNKYEKYINDIDFSKNRLWEDYETTYDNANGKYPEIENITETSKEIASLKSKIKNLGPVNLNSIDEYKEVSERYEFMNEQRNDIVEAKTNLEKVIADLVNEMKEQFIAQFTIINENFKTVFNDLFNGGSAEIVLDNEEDVLNCNIEIKAQPPGKKLQSLTLLSGGERCLTAIALLFAILQLKPSPFVILDEVEAALDDVNVTRYADFVNRYTARSQFIVVTHRKGTMEACDRMYGVTMQERGISKILSMRIQ